MSMKKLLPLFLCLVIILSGCQTDDQEKAVSVWEEGMEISGVTTSEKSSLIEEKPAAEQHESDDSGASAIAKSIQNSVNDSMAQIMEAGFLQGYTYTYEPDKKAVDVITKSCSKTSDPTKCYVESVMSAKDELDNSGESSTYAYTYKASPAVVKTVKEGCEGAEDPTQCYIDLSMAKKQTASVVQNAVSVSDNTNSSAKVTKEGCEAAEDPTQCYIELAAAGKQTASASDTKKTNTNAQILKEGCEAASNPTECYINQALAASVSSSSSQMASASPNTAGTSKNTSAVSADTSVSNVSKSASASSGKTGCEAADNPTQCYIDQANAKSASSKAPSVTGSGSMTTRCLMDSSGKCDGSSWSVESTIKCNKGETVTCFDVMKGKCGEDIKNGCVKLDHCEWDYCDPTCWSYEPSRCGGSKTLTTRCIMDSSCMGGGMETVNTISCKEGETVTCFDVMTGKCGEDIVNSCIALDDPVLPEPEAECPEGYWHGCWGECIPEGTSSTC